MFYTRQSMKKCPIGVLFSVWKFAVDRFLHCGGETAAGSPEANLDRSRQIAEAGRLLKPDGEDEIECIRRFELEEKMKLNIERAILHALDPASGAVYGLSDLLSFGQFCTGKSAEGGISESFPQL